MKRINIAKLMIKMQSEETGRLKCVHNVFKTGDKS